MRIFKEPLFLFLFIGAGLFGLNSLVNKGVENGEDLSKNVIRIEKGELTLLSETFKKQRSRLLTESEAQSLLDGYIRGQVIYREALLLVWTRTIPWYTIE
jgi:hypothetical protein